MGNVTLPVGATDKRVTEYLRAYFESERERYGAKSYVNQYAPQPACGRGTGSPEPSAITTPGYRGACPGWSAGRKRISTRSRERWVCR